MAEYPIYRLVKGTELTFTEMDNNLRWLSQNMSGSNLTLTGSSIGITGSVVVDGDVSVTGTITAKTLVVQTITSSVIYSSGSNIFGSNLSNTQTFTGSVKITGSGVYLTSGDFSGSGALLYNIPSTAIVGLVLSRISSGSATASISPNNGLVINTSTAISGSLRATSSVFFPSLTTTNQSNIITVDTTTGQLYYTASSALGSSTNIYNSDGTLTGNRTVTMSNNSLTFTGVAVTASISPNIGLVINATTEISGTVKITGSILQGNASKYYGYSNIVNAESDLETFNTSSITRIVFQYPTSSIGYSTGISDDRKNVYKYMTSSYGGTPILTYLTNSLDLTYRFGADTVGYIITDYKFVLNNSDIVTYKGNRSFSTASLTSTGSFSSGSYISGAAVMSYSLSDPLPAQIGLSGSQITHITFAKSSSLVYTNLGTASLNRYWEGYIDDDPYINVATPFPINFLGRKYNIISVTAQGYIGFDAISTTTRATSTFLTRSSSPPFPSIKVAAGDLSIYKIFTGSDAGTFRLWIQDRNVYQSGSANREYSYIFYSGSERVDLYIDNMVMPASQQASQITDGYTIYSNFSSSIYSGSGYALTIWDPAITSSTIVVKQLSGSTITAYGSASLAPSLISSSLYYVSFENRLLTGSQYPLTAYSVRNTSSLQNLVISSVTYNSGTNDTSIVLNSNLQSDYTASIYSSSYMYLNSNNLIDISVDYMSGSIIRSNNLNSSFYNFMLSSSITASFIDVFKNNGYTKSLRLATAAQRRAFKIMSSSYSGDITGSLFVSYSLLPTGGYQSVALGDYSQVSGIGVVASSSFQYVFGKYNELNDTTSTFVIGGGFDDQNRRNLLLVNNTLTKIGGGLQVSGAITYETGGFTISRLGSTFSSSISLTGFLSTISATSASYLKGSGSSILKVAGTYSNHLVINDDGISGSFSSSIFSVNDLMGVPVLDTFYDSSVRMYNYPDVIFEKSGSSIYLGTTYTTESKAVIKNNLTFDRGAGVIQATIQTTGSTVGLVTSSINKYYFGSTSSSLYYNAIISGYDTGSREIIVGDVKSTIKFSAGVATVIGTNVRFLNAEDSTASFNVIAGGTSASLQVYGSTNKAYNWAATITTQNF